MTKVSIPTLIIAGLVVLILLTFAFTYQVNFNDVAVKARFGKADASSVIREPGLRFRWPYPFESVESYDIRLRTLDTPETEIKTIDGKNVIVGAYAVWQIDDPLRFYLRVPQRSVEEAEKLMRSRIAQAQAAVIGQSTLSDFVNLDVKQEDARYEKLLSQMLVGVAPGLKADYGIDVRKIGIRRVSLPKETMQQVFASMQQERNRLAARYRQEGKSKAEGIKARAEADAKAILAFADTRATQIKSAGIAASTQILKRIQDEDREFFVWLRQLDALRAALSQKTTIFLDQNSPLFDPFVHPPLPSPPPAKTAER
jgi:membrane protease subunit HflC